MILYREILLLNYQSPFPAALAIGNKWLKKNFLKFPDFGAKVHFEWKMCGEYIL